MNVWFLEARNPKTYGFAELPRSGQRRTSIKSIWHIHPEGIYAVALGVIVLRAGADGVRVWITRNRRCCISGRQDFVFRFSGSLFRLAPGRTIVSHPGAYPSLRIAQ